VGGYLAVRPRSAARLRLFCFHHAGGGALSFARWQNRFGSDISVIPVRLPGRETRLREERVVDGEQLSRELETELGPLLDRPYAFYGHSLGALVAYSFALHHHRAGGRPPEMLAVGACSAPHLGMPALEGAEVSEESVLSVMRASGGIAGQLLDRPQWLRLTMTIMRDDLLLARSLRAGAGDPLPCPVLAVSGQDDLLVPPGAVHAWSRYAPEGFRTGSVPGDHLFVRDADLADLLREALDERRPLEPAV
jgi:surfactin synthase thioesterase subunit